MVVCSVYNFLTIIVEGFSECFYRSVYIPSYMRMIGILIIVCCIILLSGCSCKNNLNVCVSDSQCYPSFDGGCEYSASEPKRMPNVSYSCVCNGSDDYITGICRRL